MSVGSSTRSTSFANALAFGFRKQAASVLFHAHSRALALGLALALFQTSFVCLTAGSQTPGEAYRNLCQWDSHWYRAIIELGYRSSIPPTAQSPNSNVAFFPGYPLCARAVQRALHLSSYSALLLTSQAACWGFWTYLLLLWQRWRIPPRLAAFGTMAFLAHPAAFFLVCGYSESLFLLALLGLLFWSDSERPNFWLAGLHGIAMTATRMVGVPLVLVPLLRSTMKKGQGTTAKRRYLLLLAGVSILGVAAFFAYCQWRFGQWNLYAQTQAVGWNVKPNYGVLLTHKAFWSSPPPHHAGWTDPHFLSRLSVPLTLAWFLLLFVLEVRSIGKCGERSWRQRLGLYFGAFAVFFISTAAMSGQDLGSMLRHNLCVHLLLTMASVHWLARSAYAATRLHWVIGTLLLAGLFALQGLLAYRFTHALWVA